MENQRNNPYNPVSLEGLTFLALLILKLTIRQDLSWWLVWAPLYVGPITLFFIGVIVTAVAVAKAQNKKKANLKKAREDEWTKMTEKGGQND